MRNPNRIEGFVSLFILCLGSLVLLFVGASVSTMLITKTKQFQPPEVENRTKSFRLVSREKAENDLVLRFENTSALTITGYTLALGQERIGADFFSNTAQQGVATGALEEVRIPLSNLSSQSAKKIIVLTVVFQDHTAEGDSQAARLIFDRREGYATQMQRIRLLLLRAAENTDQGASVTPMAVLKQVRATISSLPERDEHKPSPGMRSGLNFAKQWTLKQIARLESGEMDVELQRSPGFTEQAAGPPKPLGKVSMGLEYIVDKVDEIIKKL
ncbi:MAG: hypothetical protein AABN33_14060 [Acidobacteriota bacterium]